MFGAREPGRRGLVAAVVAASALAPAAALAGKAVTSGQQRLQLSVAVKPAKAGARGVAITLHTLYTDPADSSQQVPYNTDKLIFSLPRGVGLNPKVLPACSEAAINRTGKVNCAASSKIGTGSVVVNGRPYIKSLITGAVTMYNGLDDVGANGFARGSALQILSVKTSLGISVYDFFHVVRSGGRIQLVAESAKPAKPGLAPGGLTIQDLRLSISTGGKPYFVAPKTCSGSWPFSLQITNYFGQPSVTARDSVPCKR